MGDDKQDNDIVVQVTRHFDDIDVSIPRLGKLVKAICSRFGLSNAAISITIVGNAEITQLNKKFLNCDRPTDCLSFDLSNKDDTDAPKIFEVVVNAEQALEQAKLRGHDAEAELALYVTHGLLHNLGFDDGAPAQAKNMHHTEDEILHQQGFGFVYNTVEKNKIRAQ